MPIIAHSRPEIEVLLDCCRTKVLPAAFARVQQRFADGIDWESLHDLVQWHGVAPLVYTNILEMASQSVPTPALEQIKNELCTTAAKNLALAAELVRILKILEERAIETIPYKGPVLAELLYGSVARRSFSDLDLLLLRKEDILDAKAALDAAGYIPSSSLHWKAEAAYLRSSCVYEFENPASEICIEVHWKNSKHPSLPLSAEFLEKSWWKVLFCGKQIKTLQAETLILLLCGHGTKHCWRRLRYICDIADLIRVTEHIDWLGLLRNADQLGARRMVLTGLSLAHGLLEAPVPDEGLQEIRKSPQVQRIAMECSAEIFHSPREEPGYWSMCWFNLRSFDNWHGRLRYLARTALRPGVRDFETAPLPRFLFPLYRCIRLLRLVRHLKPRAYATPAGR